MDQKITAEAATPLHHKLAVLFPSLAQIEHVDLLRSLVPPEQHFHKPKAEPANYSAVKVLPWVEPRVCDYDVLEYIAKKMFVTKGIPWRKALT